MDTVVWVVIAVAVVLLLLLVAGIVLKRGAEKRHHQALARAESLRGQAAEHGAGVQSAAERAQVAEAEAERKRVEAERAERAAAEAHRDLAHQQARQEDVVREADRIDPRVDTGADDYRPITGPDMKASTVDDAGQATTDEGRHRA